LVLEIWFFIIQLKKYARLCKNIVRSQLAQYSILKQLPHSWGFTFTFQLLVGSQAMWKIYLKTICGRPRLGWCLSSSK